MKTRFSQRRALAIVVLVLFISSLLPSEAVRAISSRPRWVLEWPLAPAKHLLHAMGAKIRRPVPPDPGMGNRAEMEKNYGELLAYNRRLSEALRDARKQIEQLGQFRQRMTLGPVRLQTANVIAWSGQTMAPTITINRGARHGLILGMPVASSFHLVGRLSEVGPVTATVKLITAPRTRLDVRIVPAGPGESPRELRRQLEMDPEGETLFTVVEADRPVQIGDLAHLTDKTWPQQARGLVVGRVSNIRKHDDNPTLEKVIEVESIVPLTYLNDVIVLIPVD